MKASLGLTKGGLQQPVLFFSILLEKMTSALEKSSHGENPRLFAVLSEPPTTMTAMGAAETLDWIYTSHFYPEM
ncbi:hypothetical protein N7468_002345 [Penicillium chermesinum]|uniref:Uncharacterized protein n=1 Tax=Penicillium chermesinum TaxID=63820 RepID=A0A9W9PL86_9EURO|nr:uncharacterized protein N7468_002345 [Penicillium chermesinum]KAJ5247362.1 hypothetical protein N7468_002345 [Penicillium chermesinum]